MSHSRVRGPAEHTHPCRHHHIQLIPFAPSDTPHQHVLAAQVGCMASLPGGKAGPHLAASHTWALQEAESPPAVPWLWHSSRASPAHKDLWDPNLLVGNTTQTPMAPCPPPHPSRAPCWDSRRAGHVHRVPGGDTRPVSLPSFHSLQEMMNLCLAQAALVELGTSEHSGIWVGSPAFPGSAAARAVTGVEHHHIPPQRPVGHWSSCPSPLAVQTQPEQLPITARLN